MTRPFSSGQVKLDDCALHVAVPGSVKSPSPELFVVEGESAALAVTRVRDAATQAVLAMQGKPLNAIKATEKKLAAHPLFTALTDSLGTGRGAAFDLAKLRFSRVLLLMDPDADGIHCGVLMLMFFHRWMRPLLDAGHVEIVRPPWGEVVPADGTPPRHACSEAEFQAVSDAVRARGPATARRFRGLAAIEPHLLLATCIAPATRRTDQISTAEAAAMIEVFGSLDDAT
ncbi:MAG: toprim domain-containing protein [Planctomycetia bacterium]|nr:toprim domain-containing protein [Planctomycetia bacterium]